MNDNKLNMHELIHLYIDILKFGYKVKCYLTGGYMAITTWRPVDTVFGVAEIHGHTIYFKADE